MSIDYSALGSAKEAELTQLLRRYADVAEAGGKSHWATAMRRAVAHIETLEEYVSRACLCPCCESVTECSAECTFAVDCPLDVETMQRARNVMREGT
jgi:hypothetical protein